MIAIRGAITVDDNSKSSIRKATIELLSKIIESNNLIEEEIISIIFSVTNDLTKLYPAICAREIGLTETPLFCVQEMNIEDSLKKCLRVLIHSSKQVQKKDVQHIYLKGAIILRPDLVKEKDK